jgi:branched-chain amino acid transport system permease protein
LVNGLILIFSANYRSISTGYAAQGVALGAGVRVPVGRLLAFAVAVAPTIALVALMGRTRTGLAIMATDTAPPGPESR